MSTTPRRVCLAGIGPAPTSKVVRDDLGRRWKLGCDGKYHDHTGRHHHSPEELHARTDLVEDDA